MSGAGRYDALRDTEQQVEAERLARADELVKSVEAKAAPDQAQAAEQSSPTRSWPEFEPEVDLDTYAMERQQRAAELLNAGYHPQVAGNLLDREEQGIPVFQHERPSPPPTQSADRPLDREEQRTDVPLSQSQQPPEQATDQKLDRADELLALAGASAHQQIPEQQQGIER